MDNDGKFLTFTSFQDRFKIKCIIISAIPKRLLQKAKSLGRRENLRAYETAVPLTPSLNINLYKMRIYWLYINGTTCIATGPKKWEKELKAGNIDWKAKFNNIGKMCHENRLREFNFKHH